MSVFVDSSAILALADPSDRNHGRAVEVLEHLEGPLITSNQVIIRTTGVVVARAGRGAAIELLERLRGEAGLTVYNIDPETEKKGWELFDSETAIELDPADAMSFALMRQLGIRMAFTFQKAFRQAAFITIPMA